MLSQYLEAAIGPAVALFFVGLEGVGQEAVAVAAVGIMSEPAVLQDAQPEIGVLADGVARPSAHLIQRGTPNKAHGAVHDDGVDLVTLNHADVEEAGILTIHGVMHHAAVAVAVILRRLHQPDLGIGEQRRQILQPVRLHDIIGVDDADYLGVRGGVGEGEAQRAGLEARQAVRIDELEAFAEREAVLLDRLPEGRVGRVVDHDHAFEVRVDQARDRIERCLQHLRRLEICGNVDRDFRREGLLLRHD